MLISLELAFGAAYRTGRVELCLRVAPPIIEALIGADRLTDAEQKLTEYRALSKRLDSKSAERHLSYLSHYLLLVRDPDRGSEPLFALREELNRWVNSENDGEALTVGWLLAKAERTSDTGTDSAGKVAEIARRVGDTATSARLANF